MSSQGTRCYRRRTLRWARQRSRTSRTLTRMRGEYRRQARVISCLDRWHAHETRTIHHGDAVWDCSVFQSVLSALVYVDHICSHICDDPRESQDRRETTRRQCLRCTRMDDTTRICTLDHNTLVGFLEGCMRYRQ